MEGIDWSSILQDTGSQIYIPFTEEAFGPRRVPDGVSYHIARGIGRGDVLLNRVGIGTMCMTRVSCADVFMDQASRRKARSQSAYDASRRLKYIALGYVTLLGKCNSTCDVSGAEAAMSTLTEEEARAEL